MLTHVLVALAAAFLITAQTPLGVAGGSCNTAADSRDSAAAGSTFKATIQVVSDEDKSGSLVVLAVSASTVAEAVPEGWQLCFTWLKAVVLRQPVGSVVSGSYVCLPKEAALKPGQVRGFMMELAPPSMRFISDLPRGLHIVVPGRTDADETVLPVKLVPPGEAQIRFDDAPSPPFGAVPQPLQVNVRGDDTNGFGLSAGLQGKVAVLAKAESAEPAAKLLKEWLSDWPPGAPFGGPASVVNDVGGPGVRALILIEAPEGQDRAWLGQEGYEVNIEQESISVLAASRDGFLRAAATVRQVLGVTLSEGKAKVPVQTIRDKPRFAHRGLMLDVGRHFFPVRFIKKLLDWMFLYKLNVFHWHLTDDEGWRLEVRSLPNLTSRGAWRGRGEAVEPQYGGGPGRYGGFYSQEDVRDVVRYADERGIAIIPEIDVPGHCYAAIRALPELLGKSVRHQQGGPASVQGFRGNALNPAASATYVFLEMVLTEVLEMFSAPLGVHIGMDEIPRGAWSESPGEEEVLKAQLASWLRSFLAERGRTMLGWEEAFSENSGLDPNALPRAVAMAWKDDERFAVRAANSGFDVVLCPAHFLYLDIVQNLAFEDRGLYWAAPALPIERVYSYEPMERLRRLGLNSEAEGRIRGVQANLWSETVDSPERAEEMLFPRLLAVAELAWSEQEQKVWDNFRWRLAPHLAWLAREIGVRHWGQMCGVVASGDFVRVPLVPESGSM